MSRALSPLLDTRSIETQAIFTLHFERYKAGMKRAVGPFLEKERLDSVFVSGIATVKSRYRTSTCSTCSTRSTCGVTILLVSFIAAIASS